MPNAYDSLINRYSEISALSHARGILSWDEATIMPSGSSEARANALSKIASLSHRLGTQDDVGEWIEQSQKEDLDSTQKRNLQLIQKSYNKNIALPNEFIERRSKTMSKAELAWRNCRPANDWKSFLPHLKEIMKVTKEEASIRSSASGLSPYNALLDLYEPSLKEERIDELFAPLEKELPGLINEASEKSKSLNIQRPQGPFPIARQEAIGKEMMKTFLFDFNQGRLDIAVHPFCGGAQGDVRITTRYNENDFQESLMGVIHETGHAQYEQNIPQQWLGLPIGNSVGMAVHESQSLFFEMQIGRSEEFLHYLQGHLNETFPEFKNEWELSNLKSLYQEVKRDFIRVNADEVTYPAHILLRYYLEKDLLTEKLKEEDLPEAWDAMMRKLLGVSTLGNDKDGCMQDVHWPSGAIGYFPTYTLGAMTAAQIGKSFKEENASWQSQWREGSFKETRSWLNEKIWSQGSLFEMEELIKNATGKSLSSDDYLSHLKQRYC